MPREAALFDNCIITNRKGSAKNNIEFQLIENLSLTNDTQI